MAAAMHSDVIVLGAGMVGISAALHLQSRGRSVVLVDRRGPAEETSFGNAGVIQREAVLPYTFRRDIGKVAGPNGDGDRGGRLALGETAEGQLQNGHLIARLILRWRGDGLTGERVDELIACVECEDLRERQLAGDVSIRGRRRGAGGLPGLPLKDSR